MIEKIIDLLIETGNIEYNNIKIYEYGLKLFLKRLFHILIFIIIGYLFGNLGEMVSFLVAYICIREYSGGYHARTTGGCFACTVVVAIGVSVFFRFNLWSHIYIWCITMVIAGCVIWFLSPQEAENKPLSLEEKYVYRKQTRKYLIILMVIAWIGSVFYEIPEGIASAWIIQSLMLILGYFSNWTVKSSFN